MSFSIDVNLLLYASAAQSPYHRKAQAFLDSCRAKPALVYLAWPTLMAYLRMSTHASIMSPPLTPAQASSNVDELLSLPHVRPLAEGDGFWEVYREVCRGLVVRGKLVPDAHLAAILKQHGVTTLYSNDADFRKFAFLRVINPFEDQ